MGGYQVPSAGPGDDGYDEEGYDESQRAEILEATREGPTDGAILTDLVPDLGDDEDDDPARSEAEDDDLLDPDPDLAGKERAALEDPIQQEFDDGMAEDDSLADPERDALEP